MVVPLVVDVSNVVVGVVVVKVTVSDVDLIVEVPLLVVVSAVENSVTVYVVVPLVIALV